MTVQLNRPRKLSEALIELQLHFDIQPPENDKLYKIVLKSPEGLKYFSGSKKLWSTWADRAFEFPDKDKALEMIQEFPELEGAELHHEY